MYRINFCCLRAYLYWIKGSGRKKKGDSVYKNEPEQSNPMAGKKVVFIADENDKENADGVKGHLENVGVSDYHPGIYDRYIKRTIDIVLSFGGLSSFLPFTQSLPWQLLLMTRARFYLRRNGLGK